MFELIDKLSRQNPQNDVRLEYLMGFDSSEEALSVETSIDGTVTWISTEENIIEGQK